MQKNNLYNKKLGKKGEDIAVAYLIGKGYEIIHRNFSFGRQGEIDIIATCNNILVFIEVKTRTNYKFGNPIEQISQQKRKKWYNAAQGFLYIKNISDKECRFDVIIIDLTKDNKDEYITHIENAI